eukprot:Ihof_evm5s186 gene=Ihof_evmTU5s186
MDEKEDFKDCEEKKSATKPSEEASSRRECAKHPNKSLGKFLICPCKNGFSFKEFFIIIFISFFSANLFYSYFYTHSSIQVVNPKTDNITLQPELPLTVPNGVLENTEDISSDAYISERMGQVPVYETINEINSLEKDMIKLLCNTTYLSELELAGGSPTGEQFLTAMRVSQFVMARDLTGSEAWTSKKAPSPERFSPDTIMPTDKFNPFVTRHIVSTGNRLVFWGDVHGSFGSLTASLDWLTKGDNPCLSESLVVSEECRLMFLGDFVDRGQSYGLWHEIAKLRRFSTATCDEKCIFARILRWFEFLPYSLYLGGISKGENGKNAITNHTDFMQFAHGVYEFGYNPVDLLKFNASEEVSMLHEWIGPLRRSQIFKEMTGPNAVDQVFAQRLKAAVQSDPELKEAISFSGRLTTPTQPVTLGLCWDDMIIRMKGQTPPLTAYTGRGVGWDVELLEHMFRRASTPGVSTLHGVIRGHQHNDNFGPMLTRLIKGRGYVDAYGYGDGKRPCTEQMPITSSKKEPRTKDIEQELFWVMTTISAAESNLDFPFVCHAMSTNPWGNAGRNQPKTYWKPGTTAPGSSLDRDSNIDIDGGTIHMASKGDGGMTITQSRKALPIYRYKDQILYLVEKFSVVIIVGETGCGKTTQLPQYLYEAGWTNGGRAVACTQPRRIACMTVADRVANEMGSSLGEKVGYLVRFDGMCSAQTHLKYMTDGMLVRETMLDPLLTKYSVIMLDEAHERSLHTDILLGLLKKIMRKRKDLRVIVASATLDAEEFANFFETNTTNDNTRNSTVILSVEGRMHPVDLHYTTTPVPDYVKATVENILLIHQRESQGDVLAFLTGQDEVDRAVAMLEERANEGLGKGLSLWILPFYSTLPREHQMRVFTPTPRGTRKVIISTNIAETSVTLPDIVYVLDCGFVKLKSYNPSTGVEALVITPISKASAKQRAGRAGRVRPGKAYRLYTEHDYDKVLPLVTPPEIQRTNLQMVVLQLKAMGIDNVLRFDFMSSPMPEALIRSLDLLYALGGLDCHGKLVVPLGEQLAEFPIEPKLAKMLLVSGDYECSEEMLTIAAMLQVQDVFVSPPDMRRQAEANKKRFGAKEGDHLTLLNVYKAYTKHKQAGWCYKHFINFKALKRAEDIRRQLQRYLQRFGIPLVSCGNNDVMIRKCLVSGFFANAARLCADGMYVTLRGSQKLSIHPSSILYRSSPPPWVVFYE